MPETACNNMDKDKDQSAVADFLGEFGNKGVPKDPFNDAPKDTFAKEVMEETPVEEVKEEKPLPFNKDPKVQKYLEKREKEIEERLSSKFGDRVKETTQAPDTRMDEVLTRIIGNDTPERVQGVKDMKELLMGLKGEARAEALAEIESRQNAEVQADRAAEEELENAFENIEPLT